MTITNIHFYCASDRQNYGDLLFPIILTHQLKRMHYQGAFHYFGTVQSDLSAYGAIPTRSIREYRKLCDGKEAQLMIIAGGEVLSASWPKILSFLAKNPLAKLAFGKLDRIGRRFPSIHPIIARWFAFPSPIPFVLEDGDYKHTRIAYNSVGGVHVNTAPSWHQEKVISALSGSYVSVRDKETYAFLVENRVENALLVPDCAFILSDIYPLEDIKRRISPEIREALPEGLKYFCFQAAPGKLRGNEASAKKSIESICRENDLKCVSFSIGDAAGHEDGKTVAMLAASPELREHLIPVQPRTIYDVMYIIANSRCYIGTSLHGLITAISYRRPALGLHPVSKVKATIDSWLPPEVALYSKAEDLPRNFQVILQKSRGFDWEKLLASLKEAVYQNLQNIYQLVK